MVEIPLSSDRRPPLWSGHPLSQFWIPEKLKLFYPEEILIKVSRLSCSGHEATSLGARMPHNLDTLCCTQFYAHSPVALVLFRRVDSIAQASQLLCCQCLLLCCVISVFLSMRERHTHTHQFVVPLTYTLTGCFLYLWLEIEPTMLVYPDDALTNGATWPGLIWIV